MTIFSLIIAINLTKIKIEQNFVKEKITVWDFGLNFKLYSVIGVKITSIAK